MLTPQFLLPIHRELVIDLFAGGGGASTGIEQAIGRPVDIAINHNLEAVAMHLANHPQTKHYVEDVFDVDPVAVVDGRPVGMLWASPDCKHFSKAKGGKPVSKKIRGLAWVVIKWAKLVRPRVIFLENVEEFQTWGPLDENNMPCPRRKGRTFARWKKSLENLGYKVHYQEDRACDLGTPTIRKRLFLVARCDGEPIVVPKYTHAAPDSLLVKSRKAKPYRTAAECILWDQPAPSIFERTRELADATKRRIAKGIMRRGYALLIEHPPGSGSYTRALDFKEEVCEYVIADFDPITAAEADAEEEEHGNDQSGQAQSPATPGTGAQDAPRQRGRVRTVAAGRASAVAVAPIAGG
jgi:DNA (cytosine-5)-methyltransferase 1